MSQESKQSLSKGFEDQLAELRSSQISELRSDAAASDFFSSSAKSRQSKKGRKLTSWWPSLALGTGLCAAAVFTLWLTGKQGNLSESEETRNNSQIHASVPTDFHSKLPPSFTPLGEHAAYKRDEHTRLAIEAVGEGETRLRLVRGEIEIRLAQDPKHQLSLRSAKHQFASHNADFSLRSHNEELELRVLKGEVLILDKDGAKISTVSSGQEWANTLTNEAKKMVEARPHGLDDSALDEWTKTEVVKNSIPKASTPKVSKPQKSAAEDNQSAQSSKLSPSLEGKGHHPEALWKRSRLLRGQGKTQASLQLLSELTKSTNPAWASMARVETIRILADEALASDPKRKRLLKATQDYFRFFPNQALGTQVREIACPLLPTASENICPTNK